METRRKTATKADSVTCEKKERGTIMTNATQTNEIKTLQNEIKTLKATVEEYAKALETSRDYCKKAKEQIKNQSNYYQQMQELQDKLDTIKQDNKKEEIIEYLLQNHKNGYVLENYFRDLFIKQQFKYSKKNVNISRLELSLLHVIKWKFQNNRSDITIYNTDYQINSKGTYNIKFNVDTSLLTNKQIRHFNEEHEINIPLNTLTEEEKEQLQGQDREVLVIER